MKGRVLIVAGSDSGGGAGIQADIKAVTALGGYAMTAITALTAQNTRGVFGVLDVPADFVARQMQVVLDDLGADVIKIGMLSHAGIIEAVAAVLDGPAAGIPVVLDPVMVAKGGAPLLAAEAVDALRRRLLPRAALITPNLPEAAALTAMTVETLDDMEQAARRLLTLGPQAVLLKGGHLPGAAVTDLLLWAWGVERFDDRRIDSTSTHGTGCTLASAIACGLAQGLDLQQAVRRGRRYVHKAITAAPGLGQGHGPLGHGHTVAPFP